MNNNYFYDYAIIRLVPNVEREEFVNVGVIVSCEEKNYLNARIELDEQRIKILAPGFDIETAKTHLNIIPAICAGDADAGPIGQLTLRKRFHWLTSPRSTIIQTSPVHSGYCNDPDTVLDHLFETMVRTKTEGKIPN